MTPLPMASAGRFSPFGPLGTCSTTYRLLGGKHSSFEEIRESAIVDSKLVMFSVIGWLATIIVSFFSARFGSFETRRQFETKTHQEQLLAAANIIDALSKLSNESGEVVEEVLAFQSSNGEFGRRHTTCQSFQLDPSLYPDAAKLGGDVVRDLISLSVGVNTSEKSTQYSLRYVSEDDAARECMAAAAYFSLSSHSIAEDVANRFGIPQVHFHGIPDSLLIPISEDRHPDGLLNVAARRKRRITRATQSTRPAPDLPEISN